MSENTNKVPKKNILLVNITRLGDMLQATPTIAGMKMENPGCRVTVLVEKQFESICHWLPNIDEVMTIDLGMTVRALARGNEGIVEAYDLVEDLVKELRSRNFDYCLNMSSSAYTALLLRLVGVEKHGGWVSDEEGNRIIASDWAKLFATSVFHQNRHYNSINLVDVFRCSADVEQHPDKLLINVEETALNHVKNLIANAGFTNKGPLIAIQAGASQTKRQWLPVKFIKLIEQLLTELDARIVLTGTSKELSIIEPIAKGVNSNNVFVAAGKTNIPQLAALLSISDILVTGDTGPMHISAAVGTPTVAMFLASAFGFETGPYGKDHIVLQPIIACGPCNPNKPCAKPDCHDQISPKLMADLVRWRLGGMSEPVPSADPRQVIIYQSYFDEYGFCDLKPLNSDLNDDKSRYRQAYRKLWLSELAGYEILNDNQTKHSSLKIHRPIEGIDEVVQMAKEGVDAINQLIQLIKNPYAPPSDLKKTSEKLTELDRNIEQMGFHYGHLGPVTRMFIFSKENILGSDAVDLASQMRGHYEKLLRRCEKLTSYYN
jgi:ADP-heptose:LPS heptosyltransferase